MDGRSQPAYKIMENRTPFDLNKAIRDWQQSINASPSFRADDLEELASHIRASVQSLKATGLSEEEAFAVAARKLGEPGALELEFGKVNSAEALPLPTLLFRIVAGLYLLQVGYSLVLGVMAWRELMEGRAYQRFLAGNPFIQQIYKYTNSHSLSYPPYFAVLTSVVIVLTIILVARLAHGSWKNTGSFLKHFEHSIHIAMGLVASGLLITVLPAILPGLLSPYPSVSMKMWAPSEGLIERAAVSLVLGIFMIILAHLRLHKRFTGTSAG
jgi:hypothetical protein